MVEVVVEVEVVETVVEVVDVVGIGVGEVPFEHPEIRKNPTTITVKPVNINVTFLFMLPRRKYFH